jgi:hypothetical protein
MGTGLLIVNVEGDADGLLRRSLEVSHCLDVIAVSHAE